MKHYISIVASCALASVHYDISGYKELTSFAEFEAVLNSPRSAIIKVYAPWCSACKGMEQAFCAVAEKYGDSIDFYKLNGDAKENKKVVEQLNIEGFPTIVTKIKTRPLEKKTGSLSQETFEQHVKQAIALSQEKNSPSRVTRRERKRECNS
jgi:thioredoxin-like negative regulator of GroEL